MTAVLKTKWFMPAFTLGLGLVFGAALWLGGERRGAVEAVAVIAVFAVAILLGGRSDLIRGLRGDGRDEYWQRIDVHATALAGHVTIGVILAMCAWEWAHGRSGSPYVQLGALAGLAYIAAVALLRWRS
jgi:hypothetical protein